MTPAQKRTNYTPEAAAYETATLLRAKVERELLEFAELWPQVSTSDLQGIAFATAGRIIGMVLADTAKATE